MDKPYIHPEIVLRIIESLESDINDKLDKIEFEDARKNGEREAQELIKGLFPKRAEFGVIKSHFNTERLSSEQYKNFRERIVNAYFQKKLIAKELEEQKVNLARIRQQLSKLKSSFFRFLFKNKINKLTSDCNEVENEVHSLVSLERESFLDITFSFEKNGIEDCFSDLCSAFTSLKNSIKIWDVTLTQQNFDTKAAASKSIERNDVTIDFSGLSALRSSQKVLHFENYNGGDLYFYVNFVIYFKSHEEIAIIDYKDIHLNYEQQQFLEEYSDIPSDTTQIGETWYRVNKDGTPDKRFANNYKIPVVLYGSLHFKTETGINELFYVSNHLHAKHFYEQFTIYRKQITATKSL